MKKLVLSLVFMLTAGTAYAGADLAGQVAEVSGNLKLISTLLKYLIGTVVTAGGIISSLAIYIYKTGQKTLVREIGHVDQKAEVAIDKVDELETKMDHEKDRVNKDFMTVQAHQQICGK